MKKNYLLLLILLSVLAPNRVVSQSPVTDSIDVLHYNLNIDLGATVEKQLRGTAEITFVVTQPCPTVAFDLICDSIRPVSLDGTVIRGFQYLRDERQLIVHLSGSQAGDTHVVSIPYVSNGYVESYGWGGMHMDNGIYYNLGVAFQEYPHVFGKAWFPCRDNMHDKATFDVTVTAKRGWRALCSGIKQYEHLNSDSTSTSQWIIEQPIPTYLASISTANWHIIEREYEGVYGTYPAIIGYISHDSALVHQAYDILEDVVPAYERAFGPYRWGRIGYISTPQGSMEHVSNIGLVSVCMESTESACQMTICHELGHAWFGNLITCTTAGDMWINEGGASFCEEVAAAAAYGDAWADRYYQDNLNAVLRSAHLQDGGWFALSNMPQYQTYGTTTYKKGALVWHSLRGIMGDSLFYACMQRLFNSCAFGSIDAVGLRDSLSLYSGIDLTGFFDFHVFHPGFVDYSIDNFTTSGNEATLTLRQLLRGTTHYAHGNRVPVTFFSNTHQQSNQWMLFDDSIATQTFTLPFHPEYVVVDFHHQFSDAATSSTVTVQSSGQTALHNLFCNIYASNNSSSSLVRMSHHFGHPTGDTIPGLVRLADRYWEVSYVEPNPDLKLLLLYNQGANGAQGAANIDQDFYENRATLDSLCVVYRRDAQQPWQVLSHKRSGNSTIAAGWFIAPLMRGQYALAVIDTNLVGISPIVAEEGYNQFRVVPNPNSSEFRIDMGGYDKKIDLCIYDMAGKNILTINNLNDGDTVRHHLPAGTYIALIKNKFLSLHSQIIVQ